MGRNERERRQAAQARLAAAGITPKKKQNSGTRQGLLIAGVVLVVALVAGLIYAWQSAPSGGPAAGAPAAASYLVARKGTVVTAGVQTAPVTVAVYEDFLCPGCKEFERVYGPDMTTALNAGKIKVDYHVLAILEQRSDPPGYSSLAGNAGLCAADAGAWPAFHTRLFAEQPSEGGPGKSPQELVTLGQQTGAGGAFASCVTAARDAGAVRDATDAALRDPAVAPGGRISTPTVLVNGSMIDINDSGWLRKATGS